MEARVLIYSPPLLALWQPNSKLRASTVILPHTSLHPAITPATAPSRTCAAVQRWTSMPDTMPKWPVDTCTLPIRGRTNGQLAVGTIGPLRKVVRVVVLDLSRLVLVADTKTAACPTLLLVPAAQARMDLRGTVILVHTFAVLPEVLPIPTRLLHPVLTCPLLAVLLLAPTAPVLVLLDLLARRACTKYPAGAKRSYRRIISCTTIFKRPTRRASISRVCYIGTKACLAGRCTRCKSSRVRRIRPISS